MMIQAGLMKKALTGSIGFAVIAVYLVVFSEFFPNARGNIGNDYSICLPALLDGYFWYRNNGFFSVFWFSPYLCGGVPVFPHPIRFFYSLPQLFTCVVNPFAAVLLTWLVFAAIGFWGFYFLSRRRLSAGVMLSLLCATLFLFNGFFTYRFVVGHFTYHAFMLIPWCALLLTVAPGREMSNSRLWNTVFACVVTGGFIAYMVHSSLQTVLPPVLLSVTALGLMAGGAKFGLRFYWPGFVARLAGACLVALALSAAKLSAVFHFLRHMPRSDYPLPQFADFSGLLMALIKSLFFHPAWEEARQSLVNTHFLMKRHEFEFGLTVVPLIIMAAGLSAAARHLYRNGWGRFATALKGLADKNMLVACGLLTFVFLLPLALNYYTPAWNAFLKTVPIIQSSTQCTRWFSLYIPPVILLTGLVVMKTGWMKKHQAMLSIFAIAGVIFFNMTADKRYYHQETYSPAYIITAYREVKSGLREPAVTHISVCSDNHGNVGIPVNRNDSLAFGQSQLLCYDPMFGYGLENFPVGDLTVGPVSLTRAGFLNIKNPACYVFPEENNCLPGDHFTVEEMDQAMAFARYKPYSFSMSPLQKTANVISPAALAGAGLFLICYAGRSALVLRRRKTGSRAENQA